MFSNTNRNPGPVVRLVNTFQLEMGLQIRLNYGMSGNGTMIFNSSYDKKYLKNAVKSLQQGNVDPLLKTVTPTFIRQ